MKFTVVVREIGRNTLDYSLDFDAPAVPAIGSWLSIVRPDAPHGHTEDLVVRHVWWRLRHPETEAIASEPPLTGGLVDIQVECDAAIGPHSRDRWRDSLEAARERGVDVAEFDVGRVTIREAEMPDRWSREDA